MRRHNELKTAASTAIISDVPVVSASLICLILSTFLILISAFNPNVFRSTRMFIADLTAPVLMVARTPFDAASDVIGDATGLASLRAENKRLSSENARLRKWYHRALALQVENKALQSLMNVQLDADLEFVTARVLSDHSNAYAKSMTLAAGTQNGIEEGAPVMSGDGVLGRIIEAGSNSARILLLTDMNSRIPVIIEGSNAHAILAGTNENKARLTHIPEGTAFKVGDKLLTSGLANVYPLGLPVGVVSNIQDGKITVTPYADMSHVHYVRALKGQ